MNPTEIIQQDSLNSFASDIVEMNINIVSQFLPFFIIAGVFAYFIGILKIAFSNNTPKYKLIPAEKTKENEMTEAINDTKKILSYTAEIKQIQNKYKKPLLDTLITK